MIQEKNLLLDLGDTLVQISEAFEIYTSRALTDVLSHQNLNTGEYLDQFLQYRNEFRKQAHQSLIERSIGEYLKDSFQSILDIELAPRQLAQLEKIYIQSELSITSIFDDAIPFLERAVGAEKNVYIATNNFSALHVEELLKRFELNRFIKGLHISGSVRIRKPHSQFLNSLVKEYKIHREDAIMIGDKYEMDVLAGINSGISTCLIDRKLKNESFDKGKPDYVFSSLSDVTFE